MTVEEAEAPVTEVTVEPTPAPSAPDVTVTPPEVTVTVPPITGTATMVITCHQKKLIEHPP